MGFLSETKIKRKLQQDPNNTKWTRNENTFGQKILRSQGWEPGQYLGAQNAPQSEMYTSANASYIRVAMKDDMKGLGFDKAMKDDEITGLDVFTDLLSRLNGKSDGEVAEVQRARLAIKTNRFVEQRYGAMRFVRGGLLIGDELKADDNSPKEDTEKEEEEKKSSKKRKAASLSDAEDEETSVVEDTESKKKRKKEEKSSKKRSADVSRDDTPSTETDRKAKRKEKKEKKKDKQSKGVAEDNAEAADDSTETSKPKKSKEERKEEKRLKKQRKEEKKEAKRRKKAEKAAQKSGSDSDSDCSSPATTTVATTTTATPAGSGTSTPRTNPHFVRNKFLKAKREAMLDSNAINKIFMVKA